MARQPSAETQLRTLTREYNQQREAHRRMMAERDAYRIRATKAEHIPTEHMLLRLIVPIVEVLRVHEKRRDTPRSRDDGR